MPHGTGRLAQHPPHVPRGADVCRRDPPHLLAHSLLLRGA
ncbi:hypothetical protein CKAH01_16375 [Colletotrichum kahawae]|uniref:Uncharacterized protein n=1 Tax=Colletotrichum kahawae TaxID=34407 RepID=A0AAD9YGC4_COLKA|nr:hypothetical protein CKAH01_16375 [Colletotrichum kahawae]